MPPPRTRLVCISDTHNHHAAVRLPPGDVLVHAGDISGMGRPREIEAFALWLREQPFPHKVVIAGNHDWLFEREPAAARGILEKGCPGVVYLEDGGAEIRGLRFWGSPWQPEFCNWAFNIARREDRARKWAMIPADTDVLVTHGPPQGILDRTMGGDQAGCEALAAELSFDSACGLAQDKQGREGHRREKTFSRPCLRGRLKPRVHVFGHIHEAYGVVERGGTAYVNASICTVGYQPTNAAVAREL